MDYMEAMFLLLTLGVTFFVSGQKPVLLTKDDRLNHQWISEYWC